METMAVQSLVRSQRSVETFEEGIKKKNLKHANNARVALIYRELFSRLLMLSSILCVAC